MISLTDDRVKVYLESEIVYHQIHVLQGRTLFEYMDNVAESLLENVAPAKQQMFLGVKPMIENLL